MAWYRAQIAWTFDSALPRDAITVTPHFNGTDPLALANQLKTNLLADPAYSAVPFRIKVYDATGPKPHHPLADVANGTAPVASTHARELAVCLSYYGGANVPRQRGRLYLPTYFLGVSTVGLRPTTAVQNAALNFRSILQGNMPSGHYPVVYSRLDNNIKQISNWWVDDEWDIVRSRGLRPTTRVTNP